MLLEGKTAIVYGAAGSIGAAVARAYAREGAEVFLAGRTATTLDSVARRIRDAGGRAQVNELDALDGAAVDAHATWVANASGGIDIAFNATSNDDLQGRPLLEMSRDDVMRPVSKVVMTQFLISTAVARHMVVRRSGVILAMGGGREALPLLGGAHVAWSALAGLCRQLASELGPHGIRVAWLLSPGSPESADSSAGDEAGGQGGNEVVDNQAGATMLRRRPSFDDVANVATFLASSWATTMTATEVNLTGGAVVD